MDYVLFVLALIVNETFNYAISNVWYVAMGVAASGAFVSLSMRFYDDYSLVRNIVR